MNKHPELKEAPKIVVWNRYIVAVAIMVFAAAVRLVFLQAMGTASRVPDVLSRRHAGNSLRRHAGGFACDFPFCLLGQLFLDRAD